MKIQYRVSNFKWNYDRVEIVVDNVTIKEYITRYARSPSAQLMAMIWCDLYGEKELKQLHEDKGIWTNLSTGEVITDKKGDEYTIENIDLKMIHLIKKDDEECPGGYFLDYETLKEEFDLAEPE